MNEPRAFWNERLALRAPVDRGLRLARHRRLDGDVDLADAQPLPCVADDLDVH